MTDVSVHFYEFDGCRLDLSPPGLWRDGDLVSLPPKALDLLILLVSRRGEIVTRDEVLGTVWKHTFVEEGNINYTISLLRKALGKRDLIQTVARRGYRFAGELKTPDDELPVAAETEDPSEVNSGRRWLVAGAAAILILVIVGYFVWSPTHGKGTVSAETQSDGSEAAQAYTRGKMILGKKNVENREEKAIDEFQRAISLDPTFALGYAGLSEAYCTQAIRVPDPASRDYYAKARTAAEKALELDPRLAEGLSIRGWVRRNADWDWAGSEADLRASLAVNDNSAVTHYRLSYVLAVTGRLDESYGEIHRAYEIDPVADTISSGRFPILEARREYEIGQNLAAVFLNENKDNTFAGRADATFRYHRGDLNSVIERGEASLAKGKDRNEFAWLSLLAAAYAKTGRPEKANEALKRLEDLAKSDTKARYSLAMNYAELGRVNEALDALQSCFDAHEERMIWLNVEPRFDKLRSEPRYQMLVKAMKLS